MSLQDLSLSIIQPTPSHPPTLLLTLKNTSPTTPLTLLTWNSPLDPLLIQLGLLSIIPPQSTTALDMPVVMVKRRMPPPESSLVTLEPGEETSRTVEIGERFVTPDQWAGEGKAKVQVKGRWNAVWPGVRKGEVAGSEKLEDLGGGEAVLTGEFESEVVEIEV